MSFQFPFERILSMKKQETETASLKLQEAIQKRNEVEAELGSLIRHREEMIRSWDQAWNAPMKMTDLHERKRYSDALERNIQNLQRHLESLNERVADNQKEVTEKAKEEKVWTNWRDKLLHQHEQKLKQEEQAMLDEMATIRYFRQVRKA
jgi:flagellar FliJ protein